MSSPEQPSTGSPGNVGGFAPADPQLEAAHVLSWPCHLPPSPPSGRGSGHHRLAGGGCNVEPAQEPPAWWRNPSNPSTPLPGTPCQRSSSSLCTVYRILLFTLNCKSRKNMQRQSLWRGPRREGARSNSGTLELPLETRSLKDPENNSGKASRAKLSPDLREQDHSFVKEIAARGAN